MAIGVKETQDIIRHAAVLSRNEPAVPAKLDPQEVGMATGPRHRKRALLRAIPLPDYLDPGEMTQDPWQKLDDDIYKFLQVRKDQFGRMSAPPSQQFLAEMESQLKLADPDYDLGSFLGLMRQAADLDQTRQTYVTASEKGAFHAFARRITEGRRNGENFDPGMVKRYRDLLAANHPTTNRGLADLFRLISRAARLPLIGCITDAPPLSVAVLLQVIDLATRFNEQAHSPKELQIGPMDVFLGARTVLFNRSVANPTLSIVKELVLDETGLYHDDLIELLRNVGVFGSELTLVMPESLTEDGFVLQGTNYGAVELIMAAGAKLSKAQGPVQRAMTTLADAIVHKVQQQDGHKDRQIQNILSHFNRLLQGERRSAARVTEDRQRARFDYMSAIQKASQLAKGMQTGEFLAMQSGDVGERPMLAPNSSAQPFTVPSAQPSIQPFHKRPDAQLLAKVSVPAPQPAIQPAPPTADGEDTGYRGPMQPVRISTGEGQNRGVSEFPPPPLPAAIVVGGISGSEFESLLASWDQLLSRLRKKLTVKSATFKSLAAQIAKVRALDNSLAYGLTPAGSRATSRLAKLIQSEELRSRLAVSAEIAEAMEDSFSMECPGFLASLESLIGAMYDYRPILQTVQFRFRDRMPAARPGLVDVGRVISRANGSPVPENRIDGRETTMWADEAELDEVSLRLLLGCILLGQELAGGLMVPGARVVPQFQPDGKLSFPEASGLLTLGDSDPFLAYCTLLRVGKQSTGRASPADLEKNLMLLIRLSPEDRQAMRLKYREWIGTGNRPAPLVPGLGATKVREGWSRGFERGYMAEVADLYNGTEGSVLESRLLESLKGIQADIDNACVTLEGEKLRLTRERVDRFLE
ncbi:MAG: hypothetical protein ABIW76_03050 [Fibrobacteria bacterium]